MSYKNLFTGNLSGTGNAVVSGPANVKDFFFHNNGPDQAVVVLRLGIDHATSIPLSSAAMLAGVSAENFTKDGLQVPAGYKMFADLSLGTGPVSASLSGLA